jgi:maltooligosyltrehalose trehalohydrolase
LLTSQRPETPVRTPRTAIFNLGASVEAGGTRFRLFSTVAKTCGVRLFDEAGQPGATFELACRPGGVHEALVPDVGPGARYKFVIDGRELPDPYARFLPAGVHGPAEVIEAAYRWQHPGVSRPLREHVIYELHVGTFTEAGTYAAARSRLPELVELGVTAIELMPLAAFPGRRGWGYDGVAFFAPFAPYGRPDDLRAFIDEAHGLGLAVFLDVVYNHFGSSGNYLSAYSPEYFSKEIQNAWGDVPNFAHPVMRRLVIDSALYWLEDFRFDGLRFDAIHAIVDRSSRHILRELADEVAALRPRKLLVAEDDRNDPGDVTALGLDGIWADDFHHSVRVALTGESDGYYAAYPRGARTIAEAIRGGWLFHGQIYPPTKKPRGKEASGLPAEAFVYCIQNHDQIGNRAFGDRLSTVVSPEAYATASMLLLFLPMTPLLFMGQEWATRAPFQFFTDHEPELGRLISEGRRREFKAFRAVLEAGDRIPDPQDEATFQRSKLRWDEVKEEPHRSIRALYRRMLELRRNDPVLATAGRDDLTARAEGDLLVVRLANKHGQRLFLGNLGNAPLPVGAEIPARASVLATSAPFKISEKRLWGQAAVVLAVGAH